MFNMSTVNSLKIGFFEEVGERGGYFERKKE
jgi:hypothetical protein